MATSMTHLQSLTPSQLGFHDIATGFTVAGAAWSQRRWADDAMNFDA